MTSSTNPLDWFLDTVPLTNGNLVTPLIDGAAYFGELKDMVDNLGDSPYLLISGWRLNPDSLIDPAAGQSIRRLLESAANAAGLLPRSMLWYVPGTIGDFGAGHGLENLAFTDFIRGLGGQAILDNRLPNGRFASHHQKYMVVGSDSGHAAFVGGIDIAPDRWDDSQHNSSNLREPELFRGWHDVQVKVEGPAVVELWKSFQERWNDPRRPHNFPAAGGAPPAAINDREQPNINATPGTAAVQVLKTYACKSNSGNGAQDPYPFALNGVNSYERGLVKAIDNAEHYAYLEDQYFWPCAVVDALENAVRRGVTVILLLTRNYDVQGLVPYHNFLRNSAIQQLRDAQGGTDRVFAFHLEQAQADAETGRREQIYVHSKTLIIDDRYLVIGSANINQRSMTTDSEIGVAVVDTNSVNSSIRGQLEVVSTLAREYRKQLWSEHLQTPAADDPVDASGLPAGFPTGNGRVGHIRRLTLDTTIFCEPGIIPFGLMNARTTCRSNTIDAQKQSDDGHFRGYPLADFFNPAAIDEMVKAMGKDFPGDRTTGKKRGLRAKASREYLRAEAPFFDPDLLGGGEELEYGAGVDVEGPVHSPVKGKPEKPAPADPDKVSADLQQLFRGIYLCKFKSSVTREGGNFYHYEIGLNADRRVGLLLKNPLDTIIAFGKQEAGIDLSVTHQSGLDFDLALRNLVIAGRKAKLGKARPDKKKPNKVFPGKKPPEKSETPCGLNLRFSLNRKGILQALQIYGPEVEILFSKGLVRPVRRETGGVYRPTGKRLKATLKDSVIMVSRGMAPRLSTPLTLDNNLVQISGQNLLAKLKQVDLGGSFEKPKLIFSDVDLVR